MDNDGPLFRADAFPEGADEPDEGLRRFRHAEVRPGREVEVTDRSDGVATHYPEFGDVPIREMALVEDRHLDLNLYFRI